MSSLIALRQGVLTRAQNRLAGILETHTGLLSFSQETRDIMEMQKLIKKTKASTLLEMQKVEEAILKDPTSS
ncbi:unnamed protein product [Haemonchus placei]|uniref:BLOC-1-related complex subunit 7 n=1 Tax=Haemonchus placei TaxID=6290 RepID=A0A0N4WZW0_HAEPC|nr:unnamed protein product [Haemonchus placei]